MTTQIEHTNRNGKPGASVILLPAAAMSIDQPYTEVFISESNHVAIRQACPMDEDQFIVIHPLFVPTLVEWLQRLSEEIKAAQASR